MDVYFL